uniref:Uncharacterized protein n=1 Tax=Fusarium oxysporum (strain Fo5176) TaxID=660025 RepID=A0A0D2XDB3_FUSOF
MDSAPTELAATIQAASIEHHPDPALDTNPPTAAERRQPVTLEHVKHEHDDGIDEEEDEEEDIPYSVLRPAPRHSHLPPLPDLRFEQSYLRSISKADTWWKVALITTRDQAYHHALDPGLSVQPLPLWLATLEQKCSIARQHIRCASKTLVVGSQQL